MDKQYTEVVVNITVDFTGWATDCSIEEAKERAIKSLTNNIEKHLVVSIDKESLGEEMDNKLFNEYRTCEKCNNKFLFANLSHSHIEGLLNPILENEKEVEGYYCWDCINEK